jgi:hypothetical protein
MNIEPQELPAEALAMLVENPGSSLVAQLLQHVAHQEQTIVSLRAELATAREIAHSNLCCTAKIQAELDAERARAAELGAMARRVEELESLLHEHDHGMHIEEFVTWKKRVDQALASAGAEKAHDSSCGNFTDKGDCDCGFVADPSPGASERRTYYEAWSMDPDGAEETEECATIEAAQDWLSAEPDWQHRIVRVTEIRDVIAAGDDNG